MPVLFAVVVLDLIGFGIVIPILPFLSPQLGAGNMDIALIIVSYAVCSGLCAPFWGRLSDRLGRKPVIMICLAGAALSYVMLGLADQLWEVYAARAFAGVMAGNFGVVSAMMADITKPESRAKGMGLIGSAFGLGLVLGPVIGGLLAGEKDSFAVPCLFAGCMSLSAIVAAALFLKESVSPDTRATNRQLHKAGGQASTRALLKDTGSRLFVFQFTVHNACVSSVTYIFPLWVAFELGWSAREVGIAFGVQGAMVIFLQGVAMGPLVKFFGELRLLRIAVTLFLGGALLAVFATTMPMMVGSMLLSLSAATLCIPLLSTIITHRTAARYRGRILGTTSGAASWGRVAGPLISGVMLAQFGFQMAWVVVALIISGYLFWALREADHV